MTMKIEEACKEKGTLPEFPSMYCLIVHHLRSDTLSPCWYDAKTNHFLRHVSGIEALRTDWHDFPGEKEIRPENAGELWSNNGKRWFVAKCPSNEYFYDQTGVISHNEYAKATHGKNGWERLFPKVEDESVERIEIENVKWHKGVGNGVAVVFPVAVNGSVEDVGNGLLNKSPMKMILEIPKI
jgi:hypothetical protein